MALELDRNTDEEKRVVSANVSCLNVHEVQCNLSNESFGALPDTPEKSHDSLGTDPPPPGIANWVVKPTLTIETQTLETGDNWYYDTIQPRKKCCHPKTSQQESKEDMQCCFIIATNPKKMDTYSELPRQYFGYDPTKTDQSASKEKLQEQTNTDTDISSPTLPKAKEASLTSISNELSGNAEKPVILDDKEILAQQTERFGKDGPRHHKFEIDNIRTRDLYGTDILATSLPRKKFIHAPSHASIQKSIQMIPSDVQTNEKPLDKSSSEDLIPDASKSNIKNLLQSIDNTEDTDESDETRSRNKSINKS